MVKSIRTKVLWSLVILLLPAVACRTSSPDAVEMITVEGHVSVRGNEPFAAYLLETDARTLYVLVLRDTVRSDFTTPARVRVTGRLYMDEWQGRPYAHIDVSEWERAP